MPEDTPATEYVLLKFKILKQIIIKSDKLVNTTCECGVVWRLADDESILSLSLAQSPRGKFAKN